MPHAIEHIFHRQHVDPHFMSKTKESESYFFSANLQGKYGYVFYDVCVILTNYVAFKCNKTYENYCIILLTIKNNAITTKLIAIDIYVKKQS